MCLENTLLEKRIRYAVLTGYGPMRLLVMGYYMKPVLDSHSSIWNRIIADNEVQFVSQSVNRISLVGDHKLGTANLTLWNGYNWKVNTPFPTPMSGVGVTRKDVGGVI